MIQTHAEHPLDALEQRTATLLDGLREGRKRQSRLEAERDGLAQERDALVVERDVLAAERDGLVQERDALVAGRDTLAAERDALVAGRDTLAAERDALVQERDALSRQQVSLQAQVAELSQNQDAVSVRIAELEAELAETQAQRQALFEENSELAEENRELDEQNRELEAHNARLRERAEHPETASSGTPLFSPPVRRAQGLAALMQHRPRHHVDDSRQEGQSEQAPQAESPQEAASSSVPAASSAPQPAMPSSSVEVPSAAAQSDIIEAQGNIEALGGVEAQSVKEEQSDKEAGSQADLPIDKAPSPQSLLEEWYKRYDQTFFKGHTRPLKIGIHEDLAQREPWPEKLVRRALACYVNLPRYLKSVREGADRIDLDGAVDGKVDAQAAEHAKRKLDRLQSERRKNSSSHPASRRRGEKSAQQAQSENKQQAPSEKGQGASRQHAKDESRVHKAPSSQQSAQKPGGKSPKSLPYTDPAQNVSEQDLSPEQRMQLKLDALMARHNAR